MTRIVTNGPTVTWDDGPDLTFFTPTLPHIPRRNVMSRTAALRNQLGAIAEELARLEARPDEPKAGTTITFEMQFGGVGTVYSYAAIRAGNLWYTTGPRSPKGYTWDDLLDWMSDGTDNFRIMRPKGQPVPLQG